MSKIIGIDLGTTNSCLAVVEGQQPKVIENAEVGELLLQLLPMLRIMKYLLVHQQSDSLLQIRRTLYMQLKGLLEDALMIMLLRKISIWFHIKLLKLIW